MLHCKAETKNNALWLVQATTQKKSARFSQHRSEKVDSVRQKADLDRLRFKMNQTMQLLKDEQKQQEGRWCYSQCAFICWGVQTQFCVHCSLVRCRLTFNYWGREDCWHLKNCADVELYMLSDCGSKCSCGIYMLSDCGSKCSCGIYMLWDCGSKCSCGI